MDAILLARQVGKAIQEDERFKKFSEVKINNDTDAELQEAIGQFNLLRVDVNNEMNKEDKSKEKIDTLNGEIKKLYAEIMSNPNMVQYNEAKHDLDGLLQQINTIISYSANGEDPDTIELEDSCGGSCSGCSGCNH